MNFESTFHWCRRVSKLQSNRSHGNLPPLDWRRNTCRLLRSIRHPMHGHLVAGADNCPDRMKQGPWITCPRVKTTTSRNIFLKMSAKIPGLKDQIVMKIRNHHATYIYILKSVWTTAQANVILIAINNKLKGNYQFQSWVNSFSVTLYIHNQQICIYKICILLFVSLLLLPICVYKKLGQSLFVILHKLINTQYKDSC